MEQQESCENTSASPRDFARSQMAKYLTMTIPNHHHHKSPPDYISLVSFYRQKHMHTQTAEHLARESLKKCPRCEIKSINDLS